MRKHLDLVILAKSLFCVCSEKRFKCSLIFSYLHENQGYECIFFICQEGTNVFWVSPEDCGDDGQLSLNACCQEAST